MSDKLDRSDSPERAMKVSIIVLNWNGLSFLEPCFRSIQRQTYPDIEVLLADNHSEDGSVAWTREAWPQVRICEFEKNLGYAEANNRAAREATGEILLFLNNDTRLKEDCIQNLVQTLDDPRVGAVAAKQLSDDGSQILTVGLGLDVVGYPSYGPLFYADGASLTIRRSIWQDLQGFDDAHFIFHEDVDLCWRTWMMGSEVRSCPQAIVYHVGGATLSGGAVRGKTYDTTHWRRYLGERNNLRNILKNYASGTLLWAFPLYVLVNLAEVLVLAAVGQWQAVRQCYWASYQYNWVQRRDTLIQRRRIQADRWVSDPLILKRMAKRVAKATLLWRTGVPSFRKK